MKQSKIEVTPIHPERWGDDLDVVNAARVSFDKESSWGYSEISQENDFSEWVKELKEEDYKLIHYLTKHKHTSPFNHSFITMRVKAPIFVARQLVKHKFMPWNEVSRRYVDTEPELFFPEEWRTRAPNVKQGSGEAASEDVNLYVNVYTDEVVRTALDCYNNMLENNIAPEQARMVLPQNIMTEWIWSGTLGAWLDMIKLRRGDGVQEETKEVARIAYGYILQQFPISAEAYVSAN